MGNINFIVFKGQTLAEIIFRTEISVENSGNLLPRGGKPSIFNPDLFYSLSIDKGHFTVKGLLFSYLPAGTGPIPYFSLVNAFKIKINGWVGRKGSKHP